MQFSIPSNCETGVVFEMAIMFIFEPLVVPFYYVTYVSDADDFFTKHCLDCSLRAKSCRTAGALNTNCPLGNYVSHGSVIKSLQMPIPKHVLVMPRGGDTPMFGYETNDSIRPLRLGNIGSGGGWCSGDVNYNEKDPSAIYNGYMQSIHNSDLTNQSSHTYEAYLQQVAEDFSTIHTGYPIKYNTWGEICNVINKPTSILWQAMEEEGYYKQGRNLYVKIQ